MKNLKKLLLFLLIPFSVIAQDSIIGNRSITLGSATTINDSVKTTFKWSTGATTQSLTVSPTTTTTYSCIRKTNADRNPNDSSISYATITVLPAPAYDSSANVLFSAWSALGVPADSARKYLVNNTIVHLKSAGQWNHKDVIYVHAAHARLAALVNWKNPSQSATVVNPYVGDFVIDKYFKGNNSNFRINTNYNPGDGGTYNFTQNSSSFGVYIVEHKDEIKVDASALNGSSVGNEILSVNSSFNINGQSNCSVSRSIINTTNVGLASVRRTASNVWQIQKNGYVLYGNLAKFSDVAQPVANIEFDEFCRNANHVYSNFSGKKIALFFGGSGDDDDFVFYNIMDQYYLNPIGVTPTKRIVLDGNSMTETQTYPARLFVDLGSYFYDVNKRGVSGKTTAWLKGDADSTVFNKQKPFLAKDIFFFWELTNTMAANSSNAAATYSDLVSYLTDFRTTNPTAKIIVATMLPRHAATINNANRQNDSNLNDSATLNGMIRVKLVRDGHADAICDVAKDSVMGVFSNGVSGVGEKNLTYYSSDELHPNATGYLRLTDYYIYLSILSLL